MKTQLMSLICPLILLTATAAFAESQPSPSDEASWNMLFADSSMHVADPGVALEHQHGTMRVSVFSVCSAGSTLRLADNGGEASICIKQRTPHKGESGPICLETTNVTPTAPSAITVTSCVKRALAPKGGVARCLETDSTVIDYTLPMQILVSATPRGKGVIGKSFYKSFQIPACSN